MMNAARLDVGIGGVNIASAAYHKSLDYAHQRRQGNRPGVSKSGDNQVPIIQHADVRRLLLSQKSFIEGTLCFLLYCGFLLDLEKITEDDEVKHRINDLLELLTPAAKAFGSERGINSVNEGLQVLGGAGYTKDFPLEQMARDVRIMSIYEGTTAIQSLAILGRQVIGNERRSLDYWLELVRNDLEKVVGSSAIFEYKMRLENQLQKLSQITDHSLTVKESSGIEQALADANLYQEAFGILNVAWMWIKQGLVAEEKLSNPNLPVTDIFYHSKMHTFKFFYHYELPRLESLWSRLEDSILLTLFDKDQELII
jgi:butyryl-CoA dehydrogenase